MRKAELGFVLWSLVNCVVLFVSLAYAPTAEPTTCPVQQVQEMCVWEPPVLPDPGMVVPEYRPVHNYNRMQGPGFLPGTRCDR